MPASRHGAASFARIDVDLAAWATISTRRSVSAGRVAGWRRAGLLPVATGVGERRGSSRGRLPTRWTGPELEQAQTLVARLSIIAGRGSSLTRVALALADEGLPVPGQAVLSAAVTTLQQLTGGLLKILRSGGPVHDADAVGRVVEELLRRDPGLARDLRRRIPLAEPDVTGPGDLEDSGAGADSALFAVVAMLTGVGLDALDEAALDVTLHAIGAHGVVDGVGGADGPQLLPGGAGGLAAVLELFDIDRQLGLLRRFPPDLVHASLRQAREFASALRTVHKAQPDLASHLAAETVLGAFDGPVGVVQRLVCWQAIREQQGGEPALEDFIAAVKQLSTSQAQRPMAASE